jgi:hypothetical protein
MVFTGLGIYGGWLSWTTGGEEGTTTEKGRVWKIPLMGNNCARNLPTLVPPAPSSTISPLQVAFIDVPGGVMLTVKSSYKCGRGVEGRD